MDFKRIDELLAKLKSLRPLNEGEMNRLREDFIVENTYHSNAIEGNTLTLRETALVLKEGITIGEKPIKDHLEAIGYRDAFNYILDIAGRDVPLTERIIKELHSLVLMNDAANKGKYRNVPVAIVGALTIPPEPFLIQEQIAALLADYDVIRGNRHILEAVAEFHLRFEGIHPFIDGNGRTGRLILNFELIKAGFLPVNIKYTDRKKYYDCFDSYAVDHTPEAMTKLIAGYEEEELNRYIHIVENA